MTILMRSIEEILDRIIELEVYGDPEGDNDFEEGQQSELCTLYWVLESRSEDDEQELEKRIEAARMKWRQENL